MSNVGKEQFDKLLEWLNSKPEKAAEKYEKIREGLIRYFRSRGCIDAEELSDETIYRVVRKLADLDYKGKPEVIFYGFARNVYFEYKRKQKEVNFKEEYLLKDEFREEKPDLSLGYLENCLNSLSEEDRNLITEYYKYDKREKIDIRKKLADEYKLSQKLLHTHIYRIKRQLKNCINEKAKAANFYSEVVPMLSKQSMTFLKQNLGNSTIWKIINDNIWKTISYNESNVLALSDIDRIVESIRCKENDVLTVVTLLSSPKATLDMEYINTESNQEIKMSPKDIGGLVRDWRIEKKISDEEWITKSSQIRVQWKPKKILEIVNESR